MSNCLYHIAGNPLKLRLSATKAATFRHHLCLHQYASSAWQIELRGIEAAALERRTLMKTTKMIGALAIAAVLCVPAVAQGTWLRPNGSYYRDGDRDRDHDK